MKFELLIDTSRIKMKNWQTADGLWTHLKPLINSIVYRLLTGNPTKNIYRRMNPDDGDDDDGCMSWDNQKPSSQLCKCEDIYHHWMENMNICPPETHDDRLNMKTLITDRRHQLSDLVSTSFPVMCVLMTAKKDFHCVGRWSKDPIYRTLLIKSLV